VPITRPEALTASAVGDIVAKHAGGVGIREDRARAGHTFCTMLAERGVGLEVIRRARRSYRCSHDAELS
jgi:hypothetical protein